LPVMTKPQVAARLAERVAVALGRQIPQPS